MRRLFTGRNQGEKTTPSGASLFSCKLAKNGRQRSAVGPGPKTNRLTPPAPFTDFDPLFLKTMQPTFRPHRLKRARKIGFRARKATRGGRKVLANRRRKGRKRLTVV